MDKKELNFILQQGEGLKIEFKESLGKIDEDIVAFANAEGGRIFLGVSDDGKIKGIAVTNKLKSGIQNIARNCDPSINVRLEKFENSLIIEVEEGKDKPYKCKEGFFMRIGANSQKMSRDEILDLIITVNKKTFDSLINKEFDFKKDFDEEKLSDYLSKAGLSRSITREKILKELGVMKETLNNAGILFFSKEPQKFFQQSVYTAAVLRDVGGADIIERKEIDGSLVEIVEKVMKFVEFYVKVAYKFTGKPQRENIYEYPKEAIREAVINSVMHKDYFEPGHNNILKIFPDRIRIENIWKKPKHFRLGETVFRRNPIIANLFAKIHFGEKMGSGFARIKAYCRKEKSPFPKIEFTDTHFYVVFRPNPLYLELAGKVIKKVTERYPEKYPEKYPGANDTQLKIIYLIEKNPKITREKIAKELNLSLPGVKKNIKILKDKNFLGRVGPAKGGYWKIIEKA